MSKILKSYWSWLLVTVLAFVGATTLADTTLLVDDDWAALADETVVEGGVIGTTAFGTIQKAVNAADVSGGAVTISVKAGTYAETVTLSGKSNLIYDGGTKIGRLHFIADGAVTMSGSFSFGNDSVQSQDICDMQFTGFTFTNESIPIYIMNSGTASRNIVITDNTATFATPTQSYGVFYVNSAAVDGLTVTGNTVTGNTYYSASLGAQGGTINNVIITGNTFGSFIGVFGQVLADGVTIGGTEAGSGNTFTGTASGYENIWIKDNKGDNVGKITIAGNAFSAAYPYVIGFNTKYGKKTDVTISEGNTYGGAAINGWASAADGKFLVSADAATGEAQHYDGKLYLGDDTAFKSAKTAWDTASDTSTFVLTGGAQPVELKKSESALVDNGDGTYSIILVFAQIGQTKYGSVAAAVAAAREGDTVEIVKAGSYDWPEAMKNGITLKATVAGVVFPCAAGCPSWLTDVTFDNLVFTFGQAHYQGFQHCENLTFENCTISGLSNTYGSQTYRKCTFNQSIVEYCQWVYGLDIVYDGCTFNTCGKALNVYNEVTPEPFKLVVTNCTFNNMSSPVKKPAVLIKSMCTVPGAEAVLEYDIDLDGSNTVNGNWPNASTPYDDLTAHTRTNGLWAVEAEGNRITVRQNGKRVYPQVAVVVDDDSGKSVDVTEKSDSSLDPAIAAAVIPTQEDTAQVLANTAVTGVRLLPQAEGSESGAQMVVDSAKLAADVTGNAEFGNALTNATDIYIDIDVKVTPVRFQTQDPESDKDVIFDLAPTAIVRVVTNAVEAARQDVPVQNEMIDPTHPIKVTMYTGFKPTVILHVDEDDSVIETFSPDTAYNEVTGVITVWISHFSGFHIKGNTDPIVAAVGTEKMCGSVSEALDYVWDEYLEDATVYVLTNVTETLYDYYFSCDLTLNGPANAAEPVCLTVANDEACVMSSDIALAFGPNLTLNAPTLQLTASTLVLANTATVDSVSGDDMVLYPTADVTCGSFSVAPGGSATLKVGSRALLKTPDFDNRGTVTVDLEELSGTDVTVVDYTGSGTKKLADYGALALANDAKHYFLDVVGNDLHVRKCVAMIGQKEYASLADAMTDADQAEEAVTVKLVVSELTEDFTLPSKANITIEGVPEDGKLVTKVGTVSGTLAGTVKNIEFTKSLESLYFDGGTIENCVFSGPNGIHMGYIINASGLLIKDSVFQTSVWGAHFDGEDDGKVTFQNCQMAGFNSFYAGLDDVVFDNCTFDAVEGNKYSVCQTWGTMTVTNCTIKSGWFANAAADVFIGNASAGALTEVFNVKIPEDKTYGTVFGNDSDKHGVIAIDPVAGAGGYTGGTFIGQEKNVAAVIAENLKPTVNADGSFNTTPKEDVWCDWAVYEYGIPVDTTAKVVTILNEAEFALFAKQTAAGTDYAGYTVVLSNNLDLSAHVCVPTGRFGGTFDGQDKTIFGLVVTSIVNHAVSDNAGLFGQTKGATVKNVMLQAPTIEASGAHVGALIGLGHTTIVSGVTVNAAKVTGSKYVGGLVGGTYTTFADCAVIGSTVTGMDQVGGVIGYICGASITGCKATGNTVTATAERAGGLAGKIQFCDTASIAINDNVVSGSAKAPDMAGGIAGQIMSKDDSTTAYEIKGNDIAVELTAPKTSPIGVLREGQPTAFTGKLAECIKGNWWENVTLSADTYTYTDAETGAGDQVVYRGVALIGTTPYKSIQAAIAAAKAGDRIDLFLDVTLDTAELTEDAAIFIDKSLTLNLGGKTVTVTAPMTSAKEAYGIVVKNESAPIDVLITNGTVVATAGAAAIMGSTNACLTLSTVDVAESGYDPDNHQSPYRYTAVTATKGAVVTIDSGNYAGDFHAAMVKSQASLVINGGTFACTQSSGSNIEENNNAQAICNDYSYLEINGGTFNAAENDSNGFALRNYYANNLVSKITGGTFNGRVVELYPESGTGLEISGGTFNRTIYPATGNHIGHYLISGGKFVDDMTNPPANTTIQTGCVAKQVSVDPAYWTVTRGLARIGTTLYQTLADAIAAYDGTPGDVILLDSCTGDGITIDKSLTVDFNGKTYTVDGNPTGSPTTRNQAFQLLADNTITFTNGTITSTVGSGVRILVQNYAQLTLADMTLDGKSLDELGKTAYTLSNNNGYAHVNGKSEIIAKSGGVAFDAYYWPSGGYPDGVSVVVGEGASITGKIEYAHDGTRSQAEFESKATVVDHSGTIDPPIGYVWNLDGRLVAPVVRVVEKDQGYATLAEAVTNAVSGETIAFLRDCSGCGLTIDKSLTIDFSNRTYTVTGDPAGSNGTKNQAFQLLQNNTIVFRNGKVTSTPEAGLRFIVQNYANLTLENMVLDGENLDDSKKIAYTLSTNNGETLIDGSTIIARAGETNFAFDVSCWSPYPDNVVVVTGATTRIEGNIEVTTYDGTMPGLLLAQGEVTGWLVMGEGADNATVAKADTFVLEAPKTYVWDDYGVLRHPICELEGVKYASLQEAVNRCPTAGGATNTIMLLVSAATTNGVITGAGVVTGEKAGQNIVFDFKGFTYNVNRLVGSTGTVTNGFQLLKGSTVVMINGTLTSMYAKQLVQNYADFTAMNMVFNGNFATCKYVISNNNGSFTALGETSIIAYPGATAFDVCATSGYPDGVTVTIDTTGTITGNIEYDVWGTKPADNKATLDIRNGRVDGAWKVDDALKEDAVKNLNVWGGTFDRAVPLDYCAPWYIPSYDPASGRYGVKESTIVPGHVKGVQRYPWNGLVDITFTLCSKSDVTLFVTAEDDQGSLGLRHVKVVSGEEEKEYDLAAGGFPGAKSETNITYHVIWDSNADGTVTQSNKLDNVTYRVLVK